MLDTPCRPQAVPFDQHRHGIEDNRAICSQRFKERPFIGAEGVSACCAIVPSLDIAVDLDVPYTYLAKIKTGFMVAPLSFWIHCASPRLARCANDILVRLSRLNGTAPNLRQYSIVAQRSATSAHSAKNQRMSDCSVRWQSDAYPALPRKGDLRGLFSDFRRLATGG
jgi:hypothetical protein